MMKNKQANTNNINPETLSSNDDKMKEMVTPISCDDFRNSGMLWWINRLLHTFGLAIVAELDENDKVSKIYPARVKFRGFGRRSDEIGFRKVSQYLEDNSSELKKEADD